MNIAKTHIINNNIICGPSTSQRLVDDAHCMALPFTGSSHAYCPHTGADPVASILTVCIPFCSSITVAVGRLRAMPWSGFGATPAGGRSDRVILANPVITGTSSTRGLLRWLRCVIPSTVYAQYVSVTKNDTLFPTGMPTLTSMHIHQVSSSIPPPLSRSLAHSGRTRRCSDCALAYRYLDWHRWHAATFKVWVHHPAYNHRRRRRHLNPFVVAAHVTHAATTSRQDGQRLAPPVSCLQHGTNTRARAPHGQRK